MKYWIGFLLLLLVFSNSAEAQKEKVWIISDISDPTLEGFNHMGTINDPDDVSAMAGYFLLSNMFETKGIVVASTHRDAHKDTPNQKDWFNAVMVSAYKKDLPQLNQNIGGFPETFNVMQSCIKERGERFDPDKDYSSLDEYNTVEELLAEVKAGGDVLNVLCWGSLTEPAILVKHCIDSGQEELLYNVRFIAHWTNSPLHQGTAEHPEDVANCREDAAACAYLKRMALNGFIEYYECGAIGQHGIVSGSPKGEQYYNPFKESHLGKLFVEGKFVHGSVDHSDAATYWVLLGQWGVTLNHLLSNGKNYPEIEKRNKKLFEDWSERIHNELLRRSEAAVY
ncbi:nucleoside hydrolase-like domain-containing protein [Thermophagus sp. OGC60D27]|uniref:nucleoside hydrolase-like domain-containing protein n=1 Tax=Thermophagus sp. OGC60D27 TaxID=3458415 RepID=UPI004037BF2E